MVKAMREEEEEGSKGKRVSPGKVENLQQELSKANEEFRLQIY